MDEQKQILTFPRSRLSLLSWHIRELTEIHKSQYFNIINDFFLALAQTNKSNKLL
jgi:hypothetical protein